MSVVKTYQHPKAMGNARAAMRALMFPLFFLPDQAGSVSTAYGPEDVRPGPTDTVVALWAVGRLSPVPEEEKLADGRLKEKEAYRLSWLPLDPEADYAEAVAAAQKYSPLSLTIPEDETDPASMKPGMTLFMAMTTGAANVPTNARLMPLKVVQTYENVQAEELEWLALVVRDEGAATVLKGA